MLILGEARWLGHLEWSKGSKEGQPEGWSNQKCDSGLLQEALPGRGDGGQSPGAVGEVGGVRTYLEGRGASTS